MNPEKKQTRIEARREAIFAAAREVFDRCGFVPATMDEIAEKAGLSKGSLYNYFKNKDDLFIELFKATINPVKQSLQDMYDAPMPAAEKLAGLMSVWFQRMRQYHNFRRLALEFWSVAAGQKSKEPFAHELRDMYATHRAQVTRLLEQGADEGVFLLPFEPEISATLLMAFIDGISLQMMLGVNDKLKLDDQQVSQLQKIIFDSIQTPMSEK